MELTELLLVLLAATVLCLAATFLGRNEVVRRKLRCPRTNTIANVDVVRGYCKPTESVRVKSCTLLPNPAKVDCDQRCLKHAT